MTSTRLAAAVAAVVTAVLLQATIVAPLSLPAPATLPAVLVAIVALRSGPGTGMTFGFVAGLTADLASDHPAGVLALTWTLLGVIAGTLAHGGTAHGGAAPAVGTVAGSRRVAATAAVHATLATVVAALLLTVFGDGGEVTTAVVWAPGTLLVHLLLAVLLTPLVTAFLAARAMRPRSVAPTAAAALARRRAAGTGTASDEAAVVLHHG